MIETNLVDDVDLPVETLETWLRELLAAYSRDKVKVSPKVHLKEVCTFVYKFGKAAPHMKGLHAAQDAVAKLEDRLREALNTPALPPRVVSPSDKAAKDEGEELANKPRAAMHPVPDERPRLKTDEDGQVVEDRALALRISAVQVGDRVQTKKALRGLRKYATGAVLSVSKCVPVVSWDKGSFVDARDAEEPSTDAVAFPPEHLEVLEVPKEPPANKQKKEPEEPLPKGVDWKAFASAEVAMHIDQLVHSALFQVYVSSAPPADKMILLQEPRRIMAGAAFKVGALAFLPYSGRLRRGSKEGVGVEELWVSMPGAGETRFYVERPAENPKELAEGEDETLVLFWALQGSRAQAGEVSAPLVRKEVVMKVPVASYAVEKPKLTATKKPTLTLRCACLTNAVEVPRGAVLEV